jgi:hypothetical protein
LSCGAERALIAVSAVAGSVAAFINGGASDVRTPLLLGLGALALVGLLMLGGWALTSATPEVPRHVPAARPAGEAGAGGPAPVADDRVRAGGGQRPNAVRGAGVQARDALTEPARPSSPPSSVAAPAAGAARRASAPPEPLRREPSDAAAARRAEVEAARQLADRLRAEQLRQAELARQAEAAKRAEEARRAAEHAQDDGDAGE